MINMAYGMSHRKNTAGQRLVDLLPYRFYTICAFCDNNEGIKLRYQQQSQLSFVSSSGEKGNRRLTSRQLEVKRY